jgi:hypothetical protein
MKEKMNYAGKNQGDMSPKVTDYQAPASNYSQMDANKTTQYIERQDKIQGKQASKIKGQAYQGRYS